VNCMYLNARSLRNKMPELLTTVEALKPDIIGVSESWGDIDTEDSEFNIPGFSMFRSDRVNGHHGGGVLLFVKTEYQAVETSMSSQFADQVWCKIKIKNGDELLIGVCYRSPNTTLFGKDNDLLLLNLINEIRGKPVLLMGDFNFPDIDWEAHHGNTSMSSGFIDAVDEAFLTQHVNLNTRKNSVLDLVFTSEPDMIDSVSVLGYLADSDHNILQWTVSLSPTTALFNRPSLDYSKADFPAIRRALEAIDWAATLHGDANEQWNTFSSIIKTLESQFIPLKKASQCRKKAPWMTYRAAKLVDRKHKIYKKYKSTSHPAYVKASRAAQTEMRRAKRSFEKKLAKNIDSDRKSFYAYVRNRSRSKPQVGPLVNECSEVTSQPPDMAEMFNQFFASVFTHEDTDNIPTAEPLFRAGDDQKLLDIHIDEELVRRKLDRLRSDKAPGADNISPRVLVELKDEITVPVTLIMKCSLDSGLVPDDWKAAYVTPVYKKDAKSNVSNYRPISLTSQLCKVFEAIVRDAIVNHLEEHGLVHDTQHGFRKGGSCLSNLLQFLDQVTQCIDDGICADVIYLDFAKAFDKVPHQRLLEKISKHGIDGKVLTWIRAWLSDRWQQVCVSGQYSSKRPVTSGVPQGSVLGPILFLIFINDLESGLTSSVFKFADDTKILGTLNSCDDKDILQQDLQHVVDWAKRWQMQFNTSKCKVMHLGRTNNRFQYCMDGHFLDCVDSEKDLGVQVTADLKPSRQCQIAYSKANKILGMIGRTLSYKNRDVLLQLYKSLVRPNIEYCISAWSPYYEKDKHLLERVQHRFTRMIPGMKQLSYEKRLEIIGLWTLEERRNRADLLEVFKMFKRLTTTKFDSLFSLTNNSRTRGHSAKIVKSRCRLDLRRHFFSQRVIDRWNRLDQSVVESNTINAFKSGLNRIRQDSIGFFTDS